MANEKSKIINIDRIDRYNRPIRKSSSLEHEPGFGDKAVVVAALMSGLTGLIMMSDKQVDDFIASKQPTVNLATSNVEVFNSNKSISLDELRARQLQAKSQDSNSHEHVESFDFNNQNINYEQLSNNQSYILAHYISDKWKMPYSKAADIVLFANDAGADVDVNPVLILSVMARESSFKENAVSSAGAEGLMQVLKEYHEEKFTNTSEVTPKLNTLIGASILKEYLDMEPNSLARALQRYNGSLDDKSMNYSKNVLAYHDELEQVVSSARDEYKPNVLARSM